MRWNPEPVEVRYWRKVDKTGDCWLWTASTDTSGYGIIRNDEGKLGRAHRLSYEWHYGDIPEGMCVCHTCDVRRCVNPAHLFLGSRVDNAADMVAKGRSAKGAQSTSRLYPWLRQRGIDHPKHKLTEDAVRDIRQRYAQGGTSIPKLCREFGVANGTVQAILEGKTWRHVR